MAEAGFGETGEDVSGDGEQCCLFRDYPLGDSVNGSPHSVCVSLPRLADVIGYEEKEARVLETFAAGYPRFFRNPLVAEWLGYLESHGIVKPGAVLLPTRSAAEDCARFAGLGKSAVREAGECWAVESGSERERQESHAFLQHCGCGLSSREAEALLVRAGKRPVFGEERASGEAEALDGRIRKELHGIYGTECAGDIRLCRSGMNAFYAGFRAGQAVQAARGRDLWIQLGWLYVDTIRVLERFTGGGDCLHVFTELGDLDGLERFLGEAGHRLAGIVTETPTNPLVQTADVERLRDLADRYGGLLILDPTLASPHNVNVLAFSDLHINSLTKYAAASADVMMGAVALNRGSRFYDDLGERLDRYVTSPGQGDLGRMAKQIGHYGEVIERINCSTRRVAEFLEAHTGVEALWWAEKAGAENALRGLQVAGGGPGGIISFTTKKPIASFYDSCRLVKSPSFGARFTMVCPFLYLAHYDLVRSAGGRAQLEAAGLAPDLLRLSVGLEPVEAILEELERSLSVEA